MSEDRAQFGSDPKAEYFGYWPWLQFDFRSSATEFPTAFREFMKNSCAQARENCEIIKASTRTLSEHFQSSYSDTSMGFIALTAKLFESSRISSEAAFEFAEQLVVAKSPMEASVLLSTHARKRLEAIWEQGEAVAVLAQNLARPIPHSDAASVSQPAPETS